MFDVFMTPGVGNRDADDERPLWANAHDFIVEIEQLNGKHKVPPSVKARVDAPLSDVPSSGKPQSIFACFNIMVTYKNIA